MTLNQLPNLALFIFSRGLDGYPPEQVWQKQFRRAKTSGGKWVTVDYIAQAKKTRYGWTRDSIGKGGLGGRQKVTLVAIRRVELQVRSEKSDSTQPITTKEIIRAGMSWAGNSNLAEQRRQAREG